jgi:hypothetical protein
VPQLAHVAVDPDADEGEPVVLRKSWRASGM